MRLWQMILDLLFPPRCLFCGKLLPEGADQLCPACREQEGKRRGNIRQKGRGYALCISPFSYEGSVREAILRYKFSGQKHMARPLGRYLAQAIAEELGGEFDLVTWVPVHRRRRRQRGYDQSQLLAREACRLWDTEPVALLKKQRSNPPNSGIRTPSARRANVLGAYCLQNPGQIPGKRILLIDDIVTTGSTLSECARILKDAGAEHVVCATLAATKEDHS